jgi:hypothetical protein
MQAAAFDAKTHFQLGCRDRFREAKEWQCQIDEAILVLLDVGLAIDDLEISSAGADTVM